MGKGIAAPFRALSRAMGRAMGRSGIRQQLDEALRAEIVRLELLICRLWQVLAVIGVAVGVGVWGLLGLSMGAWCALGAVAYLGWFSLEVWWRERRGAPRWLGIISVGVESTMPWAFLLVIAATQGATHALGSWVPPMLFGALIVAATGRLRPIVPVVVAVSGALTFPTLYFLVIRDNVPIERIAEPLFTPAMQLTRGITLLFGGIIGGVVAGGLRRAIGTADSAVRARDLFGKYRLEQRIASGGMGTVYQATYCPEGGFERRVAVKRIHPHLASKPGFVDAFRREAELSARLVHPNIVQVLDFGRVDDTYYLAMEHIEGLSLAAFKRRLQAASIEIEPALVAHIGREVLAGLVHSHTAARDADGAPLRVVHRDLCPDNVLVSRHGEVKIADFGVARALRDAAATDTRTVAGHVAYMAPEQARAMPVDERADLFSLGVMLWELLCGEPLFQRGGEAVTLMAMATAPIPPPSSVRAVDQAWDTFLARVIERDVNARVRTARAMAHDLESLADARPTSLPSGPTEALAALVTRVLDLPQHEGEDETQPTAQMPTRVVSQ